MGIQIPAWTHPSESCPHYNIHVAPRAIFPRTGHHFPPHYTRPVIPNFNDFAAILLDLDGTVYHEEHALPGAIDLIRRLQRENRKFACLTNSTTSPDRIAARLLRMGVDLPAEA